METQILQKKTKPVINPGKKIHKQVYEGQHAKVQSILRANRIQPKLSVGQPNDQYEQEADRVADQVMRMPELSQSESASDTPRIQRRCDACEEDISRQPIKKNGGFLQAKHFAEESDSLLDANATAQVAAVRRGAATPLPGPVREYFEPRFGRDFSSVRVHTDANAAESANTINARAYTLGQDVVFGSGQYKPHTETGKQLLAHELTHVVQQRPNHFPKLKNDAGSKVNNSQLGRTPTNANATNTIQRSSSDSSGSGKKGGGTPAPGTGAACKVDVRATHIGGILGSLPIWHLFIVYTDSTGTEFYYRGGPGGSCTGVNAGTYGTIQGSHGRYVPGTVDWDPGAPSVTVLSGPTACGKGSCFASELSRIDGTCTPYAPTGPNSNTVASTLLSNCSVPRSKPVFIAPGWGDPNL